MGGCGQGWPLWAKSTWDDLWGELAWPVCQGTRTLSTQPWNLRSAWPSSGKGCQQPPFAAHPLGLKTGKCQPRSLFPQLFTVPSKPLWNQAVGGHCTRCIPGCVILCPISSTASTHTSTHVSHQACSSGPGPSCPHPLCAPHLTLRRPHPPPHCVSGTPGLTHTQHICHPLSIFLDFASCHHSGLT